MNKAELNPLQRKLIELRLHYEEHNHSGMEEMLEKVLERIVEETPIQDVLQNIADIRLLANWSANLAKDPTIQLVDKESAQFKNQNGGDGFRAMAFCNTKTGNITLPQNDIMDNPTVVLHTLSTLGFPSDFLALFHEKLHQLQIKSKKTPFDHRWVATGVAITGIITGISLTAAKEKIGINSEDIPRINDYLLICILLINFYIFYNNRFRALNSIILFETQANIGDRALSISTSEKTLGELIQAHVKNASPMLMRFMDVNGWNLEWFNTTVDRIKAQILQLRALGASHREIAALVAQGEGGDISYGAPVLQCEILRRKIQQGIDDIVLIERIEEIERMQSSLESKVTSIAREVIEATYAQCDFQHSDLTPTLERQTLPKGIQTSKEGDSRENARLVRKKKSMDKRKKRG